MFGCFNILCVPVGVRGVLLSTVCLNDMMLIVLTWIDLLLSVRLMLNRPGPGRCRALRPGPLLLVHLSVLLCCRVGLVCPTVVCGVVETGDLGPYRLEL